jgi:hypothetical protein
MDIHKNARLTPKASRADRAPSAKWADAEGRRIRRRRLPRTHAPCLTSLVTRFSKIDFIVRRCTNRQAASGAIRCNEQPRI